MPIIDMPDGKELDVPDDATPDEIQQISRDYYVNSQNNANRKTANLVGSGVGIVAGAPLGLPGIIGGAGAGSAAGGKLFDSFSKPSTWDQEPQQEKMALSDMAKQAVSNIPSSAGRLASETWEAVKHPIDTVSSIGDIAGGFVQKAIPALPQGNVKHADATIDYFANRYGGIENLKQTVASDPVGFLADLSTVMSGGGAAVTKVGGASKLGKLGNTANNIGQVIDPVTLAVKQPVTMGMSLASPLARQLYTGSMKASVANLTPAEKTGLFETAIKRNIPVNAKGLETLESQMSDVGGQIGDIYKQGTEAGDTINRNILTDRLADLQDKAGRTASPMKNQAAVEGQWRQMELGHPDEIPVDVAKDIRTSANEEIYSRSASNTLKSYKDKALKEVSDGVREQVHAKYPELAKLDPEYSEIKDLHKALEKAVSRIDNHNILSLTGAVTSAGLASYNPALLVPALITSAIAKSPGVKSKLALALIKARGLDARKMKVKPARDVGYQSQIINQITTTKDGDGNVKKIEVK